MKLPKRNAVVTDLEVVDVGKKGKGVAKNDSLVVFIEGGVPGDRLDARVTKRKKSYVEGTPVQFHAYSNDRVIPFCEHFDACGGCKAQHISYEAQTRLKAHFVKDNLTKIGNVPEPNLQPIVPAPAERYYRNRLDFAFTNNRWITEAEKATGETVSDRQGVGLHVPGRFDRVIDIEHCYLQPEPSNRIRLGLRDYAKTRGYSFYDTVKHEGFLRSLIIRTSSTGEVMVILMVTQDDQVAIDDLLTYLQQELPAVTSINYVINNKANDTFFDLPVHCYAGKPALQEQVGSLKLDLGPKSFYQTNSEGARVLFDLVDSYAAIQPHETVYDLYTGVGSIALYLASQAKQVIGIEAVEEAVAYAEHNAALNGITNAAFYAGDMRHKIDHVLTEASQGPDFLITDPPREGMHPKVVKAILRAAPGRLVYVSCNPATQARDLELLQEKYEVVISQPVDLFPHTYHVENVVLLNRKTEGA